MAGRAGREGAATAGGAKKESIAQAMLCRILVGASGLEPPTPTMSRWCSNQLSYAPSTPANYTGRRVE